MDARLRGTLSPCPLPWSISPSGSFLAIAFEEEADATIVEATVNRLDDAEDELRPDRVRLSFAAGFRLATHGLGASGRRLPEGAFELASVEAMWKRQAEEARFARWRRSGLCESSGVYEVLGSLWEGEPLAAPWRHFVLSGTEVWMEIVARSCNWVWAPREGTPARGGGDIAPPSASP